MKSPILKTSFTHMHHENKTNKILALDLATTTGFAILANGLITSGSTSFARRPPTKTREIEHAGAMFARFDGWISAQLQMSKCEEVVYEEVFRFMSSASAHTFCGFRSIMLLNCATAGIRATGYSPTTIKKSFTGSGNAKKEDMILEAQTRWSEQELTIIDDNQVDAIAILHLHLDNLTRAAVDAISKKGGNE